MNARKRLLPPDAQLAAWVRWAVEDSDTYAWETLANDLMRRWSSYDAQALGRDMLFAVEHPRYGFERYDDATGEHVEKDIARLARLLDWEQFVLMAALLVNYEFGRDWEEVKAEADQ